MPPLTSGRWIMFGTWMNVRFIHPTVLKPFALGLLQPRRWSSCWRNSMEGGSSLTWINTTDHVIPFWNFIIHRERHFAILAVDQLCPRTLLWSLRQTPQLALWGPNNVNLCKKPKVCVCFSTRRWFRYAKLLKTFKHHLKIVDCVLHSS